MSISTRMCVCVCRVGRARSRGKTTQRAVKRCPASSVAWPFEARLRFADAFPSAFAPGAGDDSASEEESDSDGEEPAEWIGLTSGRPVPFVAVALLFVLLAASPAEVSRLSKAVTSARRRGPGGGNQGGGRARRGPAALWSYCFGVGRLRRPALVPEPVRPDTADPAPLLARKSIVEVPSQAGRWTRDPPNPCQDEPKPA